MAVATVVGCGGGHYVLFRTTYLVLSQPVIEVGSIPTVPIYG